MFGNIFSRMTPIVKNLLILNGIVFLAQMAFPQLTEMISLYLPQSDNFLPWQYITNVFAHGNFSHLFFNMFGIVVFGSMLEQRIGSKKFFLFYIISGVGASILYNMIQMWEFYHVLHTLPADIQSQLLNGADSVYAPTSLHSDIGRAIRLRDVPCLGASGALFGLLVSFAMFFPNLELFLLFPPIPIKAKYLALGYVALELFSSLQNMNDGIAHTAHITGALIGYLLTKFWLKRSDNNRYY